MNFGEHFTIDGYGGDPEALGNKELVLNLFGDLLKQLDMHPLSEPFVIEAPDNGMNDPGGWSGFVVIVESHISVHTFPKRKFVSADVYTCKNGLDTDVIKNYFIEKFKLEDVETNLIKRGTRYPSENLA